MKKVLRDYGVGVLGSLTASGITAWLQWGGAMPLLARIFWTYLPLLVGLLAWGAFLAIRGYGRLRGRVAMLEAWLFSVGDTGFCQWLERHPASKSTAALSLRSLVAMMAEYEWKRQNGKLD